MFGDQEGVTGKYHAHVVMPPYVVRAAFVVVQAELSLEIFVGALDAPTFFESVHELLARGTLRHGRKHELGRSRLTFRPLDEQPLWRSHRAVVTIDHHAQARELELPRFGGQV